MHTAHCARHITLCTKCNEPIPKREFQNHICDAPSPPKIEKKTETNVPPPKMEKTPILAPILKPKMEKMPVSAPILNPKMPECQFCHLEFETKELAEHENYCGSRTEKCPECSDFVMLRDWEKHQSMRLYHGKNNLKSGLNFSKEKLRKS